MTEKTNMRSRALETNKEQKEFYNRKVEHNRRLNPVMKAWESWRSSVYRVWSGIGVFEDILELHREWVGDLTGKRVLDLGCYRGNRLSVELADRSNYYLGIDLSEKALETLRSHLDKAGVKNAEVRAMDFLASDFDYEPFDIVYANAVLHHFEDFDLVMSLLHERMAPGGRIVCFDPLETAFTVRLIRALYRPFQINAAWEWPFRKHNFDIVRKHFEIEHIQGVVGWSKWVIPLTVLPVFRRSVIRMGRKLHERDKVDATSVGKELWRCMSVSMCLRKK